jgi:HK97 family phage prohead protease
MQPINDRRWPVENFTAVPSHTTFKASKESRTFEGLVLPFNVATVDYRRAVFAPGSVALPENPSRVKVLAQHQSYELEHLLGHAISFEERADGIYGKFQLARSATADAALDLLLGGSLDAMSAGISVAEDAEIEYTDDRKLYKSGTTLLETSLVIFPAFDGARIETVTASPQTQPQQDEAPVVDSNTDMEVMMTVSTPQGPENLASAIVPEAPNYAELTAALTEGFASVMEAVKESAAPAPAAAPVVVASDVRERPVYGNGSRHSFIQDAWNTQMARGQAQQEAADRFRTVAPEQFAPETTSTIPALVPTENRPELYLEGDAFDRPLYSAFSKGTISDAVPFRVPVFTSSANLSRDQVEGTNSAEGQVVIGEKVVAPTTVDGLFIMTRQLAEGATPQLDAIARLEMSKALEEKIESRLATLLFGTAPTVADPAITGVGDLAGPRMIRGLRRQMADGQFRRGGQALDRIVANQAAYTDMLDAVDSTGRPLLPPVGGTNAFGSGDPTKSSISLDGRLIGAGWALNPAGVPTVLFAARSAWCWTSAVQGFRFEERSGPARIELALYSYIATTFLRPADLVKVTYTRT